MAAPSGAAFLVRVPLYVSGYVRFGEHVACQLPDMFGRREGGAVMKQAGHGSTVTVHYIGTLDNGHVFDSTPDGEPLVLTIGSNQVFPALEEAVVGMVVGETRNIILQAADAFGPRLKENIITLARSRFPAEKEIRIGQKLGIEFTGGRSRVMLVIGVDDETVTLDGNHPLAGLDLTFALQLVDCS